MEGWSRLLGRAPGHSSVSKSQNVPTLEVSRASDFHVRRSICMRWILWGVKSTTTVGVKYPRRTPLATDPCTTYRTPWVVFWEFNMKTIFVHFY